MTNLDDLSDFPLDRLLSLDQAAEALGISRWQLVYRLGHGKGPRPVRVDSGSGVGFSPWELLRWRDERLADNSAL